MKQKTFFASAAAAAVLIFAIAGCGTDPNNPPDPAKIATAIKVGTGAAVAVGFVAIPNEQEANEIATLTAKILDENVLPLLAGDEAAIVNGLQSLLELKAFDDPRLEKAKLVLEAGLPILEAYLPPDLLDKPVDKIPADVKAYLTAFFEGARDGIANYLGNKSIPRSKMMKKGFLNYADLRAKLNK